MKTSRPPEPTTPAELVINPFPGHMMVRQWRDEEVTEGGLVMPEKVRKDLAMGTVIGLGATPDEKRWPTAWLHSLYGHVVFWKAYAGTTVEYDGEKYLFLEYVDILGWRTANEPNN